MKNKNQQNIINAYNSSAKIYSKKFYNELDYKPLDRQLLDRFAQLIPKNELVCDIGCGPGEVANYLFNKKIKVMGIDASGKMIEEAKKMNPKIRFKIYDMFNLDIPDNYFFGITSFYAIGNYRYNDIKKIIKDHHRVLKKNGILLIAFHSGGKKLHVDNFFEIKISLDFYFSDEDKIIKILKETGFNILEALVRYPYKDEYPSKRAYIIGKKN